LSYLGDTKKVVESFLIRKIGEKEMQMKLQPVCENLLCKILYGVCHSSS